MKVSLSWLNQYISVKSNVQNLSDDLTMLGLEVDAVTDRYAYLESVVVGRVATVETHPNADKLKICEVETDNGRVRVVCGAPNVAPGLLVPLALPGTVLPDGSRLQNTVIRGEASEGMICSAVEIGLGPDADGIMILDPGLKIGTGLIAALGLKDSTIEIDLTPNRPDCLSVLGVAREIAGIQHERLRYPETKISDETNEITSLTSVHIENADACPRYSARMIIDIKVGPSPFWLQDRLLSVGLRPINNIVDITNFVMMETGQPLHAFDFDRLAQHRIVVRNATEGETFVTLDGKDRKLSADTLMICDGEKPVGIGGVMGGENSEIAPSTRRVLLESACFDPISIRRTAKKLGIGSDASHRFERGVDPKGTINALNRAAVLIAEIGGGRLLEGLIDEHPKPAPDVTLPLRIGETNRLLGLDLTAGQIQTLLESIEFATQIDPSGEILQVAVPSFRVDVCRPVDLMEEVARLTGYNQIPTTYPKISAEARIGHPASKLRNRLRNLMAGFGFSEAINYSFIRADFGDRLQLPPDDPLRRATVILNPISEDQSVMRTSLVPGLLETLCYNLSQQIRTVRVFEVGKIFLAHTGAEQLPEEKEILAGIWSGYRNEASWHGMEHPVDYYDIKGVVESLLQCLGVRGFNFDGMPDEACTYTQAGRTARICVGTEEIGWVGECHPATRTQFGIGPPAFLFEIQVDRLSDALPATPTYRRIPKFPAVTRDITIIVDEPMESAAVLAAIGGAGETLIEDIALFDVFQGEPIPNGKKSISIRLTYRSTERTLEDEEVNQIHRQVTAKLLDAFDATLPA
jgi:phenylalanyl-tRNA synthetase beta chain